MQVLETFPRFNASRRASIWVNCVSRLALLHFGLHALRFGADGAGVSSILPQQKRETAEPDAPNNSARRVLWRPHGRGEPTTGPDPEPETRARPQLTAMRFPTTSQPAPTWDSHLSDDVRAEVATTLDNVTRIDPRYDSLGVGVRNGEWQDVTPIFQRDPGDEQP